MYNILLCLIIIKLDVFHNQKFFRYTGAYTNTISYFFIGKHGSTEGYYCYCYCYSYWYCYIFFGVIPVDDVTIGIISTSSWFHNFLISYAKLMCFEILLSIVSLTLFEFGTAINNNENFLQIFVSQYNVWSWSVCMYCYDRHYSTIKNIHFQKHSPVCNCNTDRCTLSTYAFVQFLSVQFCMYMVMSM